MAVTQLQQQRLTYNEATRRIPIFRNGWHAGGGGGGRKCVLDDTWKGLREEKT
jgi:hypothetical protein